MGAFEARMLNHFNHTTPWTFTTSSGISGGLAVIGVAGGTLYLTNGSSGELKNLHYLSGGLSLGPLPGSFGLSTSDMWSKGLGSIRAPKPSLTADELTGPMCVISGSLAFMGEGLSGSMYFLGFPMGLALLGGAIEILISGLLTARAFGVMVGHFSGVDASVSLLPGYAH